MPKKPKRLGRPPRVKNTPTIIITLRATDAERAAWRARAGKQPLGEWIRAQCNKKGA